MKKAYIPKDMQKKAKEEKRSGTTKKA